VAVGETVHPEEAAAANPAATMAATAATPPAPAPSPASSPAPAAAASQAAAGEAARQRVRTTTRALVALLAIALLGGGFAWIASKHAGDTALRRVAPASAIVLPLRVDGDPADGWLRLGGMDFLAQRLRDGGLVVPPSESVVALLQAAGDADDADDAATRALRDAAPTALLVRGRLRPHDHRWHVDLHASGADGAAVEVEAEQADALAATRDAADRLLGRLGRAQAAPAVLDGSEQERQQRAQAALLANDLAAARAILVGDPQLARAEPQLGYRLAQVDFRAGEYRRAEASLDALLAEAGERDPLFRAQLLNGRGAVHIRLDDYAAAERDYDAAVALLHDGRHPRELGLALTGRGVTHSMRHDAAPALADFGDARVQLEAAGDALAVARVDSNLGGLEMNRDRPEQALAYLERAAAEFERYGAINELMETLESLVSDHLALLQPLAALAASDRSWLLAPRVTDPNQRLDLTLDRVDVFLALGRLREAGTLLRPLPDDVADANPFLARRLPALRARLALAEGRDAEAADAARRALGHRPPGDDEGEGVAEIALVLQRAVLATPPRPADAPAAAWVPHRAVAAWPVQAVLEAEWADAQGDADEAARRYVEARDLAERRGVPADVALVAASYGDWLLRHGRLHDAGTVIGRVSAWADRDFDCAVLQLRLFDALQQGDARAKALQAATALAGERTIPSLREAGR
jgi:tetratricopeptide (TPR) repeat protein